MWDCCCNPYRNRFEQWTSNRVLELCALEAKQTVSSVVDSVVDWYANAHQTSCLQTQQEKNDKSESLYCVERLSSSPMAKRNCNDFLIQATSKCNCVNTRTQLRSASSSVVCVETRLRNLGLQEARLLHTVLYKTRLELKVQFVMVAKN